MFFPVNEFCVGAVTSSTSLIHFTLSIVGVVEMLLGIGSTPPCCARLFVQLYIVTGRVPAGYTFSAFVVKIASPVLLTEIPLV